MIRGGNKIVDDSIDDSNVTSVMEAVHTRGFRHLEEANARCEILPRNFVLFVFMFVSYYLKIKFGCVLQWPWIK